jgi:hypothetical protein
MVTLKEIQKETARKAREGYMREVQNKAERKAAGGRPSLYAGRGA